MDKQLYFSVNEILEEPWFRKILVVVTAGGKTNAGKEDVLGSPNFLRLAGSPSVNIEALMVTSCSTSPRNRQNLKLTRPYY